LSESAIAGYGRRSRRTRPISSAARCTHGLDGGGHVVIAEQHLASGDRLLQALAVHFNGSHVLRAFPSAATSV
jgi:hypothetical protein